MKIFSKNCFIVFQIGMVFASTVLGAGFASGREIVSFFGRFSGISIAASSFITLCFFFSCWGFLSIGSYMKGMTISDLNKMIFGKFSWLADVFLLSSHAIVLSGMLAGSLSVSKALLPSFDFPIVFIIILVVAFCALIFGFKLIVKINIILLPLLVLFILFVSFSSIFSGYQNYSNISFNLSFFDFLKFFLSSILYIGMNMLTATPVLAPLGNGITKTQKFWSSFIGSAFIGVLMSSIMLAMFSHDSSLLNADMPMLEMSNNISPVFGVFCSITILCATFTTMLCSAFALQGFASTFIKWKPAAAFAVLLFGTTISFVGFVNIVNWLYPAMGVMGAIFIMAIFISIKKIKKNEVYSKITPNIEKPNLICEKNQSGKVAEGTKSKSDTLPD